MRKFKENGSITLETSIVLPIFIFIFLFIYGLFSIVSTQNKMTHALVQATNSMALDSYLTGNVESEKEAATKFWSSLPNVALELFRRDNDPYFSSRKYWYSKQNDMAPKVAKQRFIGFLGGNEASAKEQLEGLKIVNGLDGVHFKVTIVEKDVTVKINYEIQYWFDFFGMGKIPMEQAITTHLWM